jgi:long-chain acyl-CoA synthetase
MDVHTLCDLFYRSVDTFKKPDHLRYKAEGQWRDISSVEVRVAVEELSMGLRALGIERRDRVAIMSENRPEWAIADLAVLTAGAVDVPIYPTVTAAQVQHMLEDSGCKAVFVSNTTHESKVAEVRARLPQLQHVIRMDDGTGRQSNVMTLDEVRARGRGPLAQEPDAVRKRAGGVKADDLATLIYTSGTTGQPKGVMLLHSNIVSNVLAGLSIFAGVGPADTHLSFLPLCHILERMGGLYVMLHCGATIAYAESIDAVPANMLEVRPTLMIAVPRFFEKVYAKVQEKVSKDPPARQRIFRWAVGVGRQRFAHQVAGTRPGLGLRLRHKVAEKLVFAKVKERTGGRMRLFVSGGAPLGRELAEFFGAVGLLVLEGYGLTETSPVIAVNLPGAMRPGTVGKALPGVEVKIAPDGEILARGPNVMKGYYNQPAATAEVLERDGWFHTGDVGVLDADGYLTITDRKKDILVTSAGKNIAPQPIENRLKTNPFVAEVVMVGNKRHFPAALVVPSFDRLEKWAAETGVSFGSREELVGMPQVQAHYQALVDQLSDDLAKFERIKRIKLLAREFTIEAGELTPTMKVKRRVIEQKYKSLIDEIYEGAAAPDQVPEQARLMPDA